MNCENNYQEAKRRLSALRAELDELPRGIAAAATAGDVEERSRLRERQKELPGRIIEAQLDLCSLKLAWLKAAQAERRTLLEQEQATSRATDERVAEKLVALDAERKRLTAERYSALQRVYRLKGEIGQGDAELHATQQELKSLLERATAHIV